MFVMLFKIKCILLMFMGIWIVFVIKKVVVKSVVRDKWLDCSCFKLSVMFVIVMVVLIIKVWLCNMFLDKCIIVFFLFLVE